MMRSVGSFAPQQTQHFLEVVDGLVEVQLVLCVEAQGLAVVFLLGEFPLDHVESWVLGPAFGMSRFHRYFLCVLAFRGGEGERLVLGLFFLSLIH
jgi:hypothetical protein